MMETQANPIVFLTTLHLEVTASLEVVVIVLVRVPQLDLLVADVCQVQALRRMSLLHYCRRRKECLCSSITTTRSQVLAGTVRS